MRLSGTTIGALLVLGAWFALNFAGVPKLVDAEPVLSLAGLMLAVLAAAAIAGFARLPYVAPLYALSLLIWAALQVETHWSTYLFVDAGARKLAWHTEVFGAHWRVLPAFPNRTTPDGYHTVLFALILLNLGLALADTFRRAGRA